MASDLNQSIIPAATTIFNSSGNYTAPAGVNRVFVSVVGAAGGPQGLNQNGSDSGIVGGAAISGGSVVAVVPGTTYAVTIGAAGTRGAQGTSFDFRYGSNFNLGATGTAGGSTGFESVTIANGGTPGASGTNGSNGTMTFNATTLPPVVPTGAVARVSATSTGATQGTSTSGQIQIFPVG